MPTPSTSTARGSHHRLSPGSESLPCSALWILSHSSPASTRCTGRKRAAVSHGETSPCAEGLHIARRTSDGMTELSMGEERRGEARNSCSAYCQPHSASSAVPRCVPWLGCWERDKVRCCHPYLYVRAATGLYLRGTRMTFRSLDTS